jgi:hypothetical protein
MTTDDDIWHEDEETYWGGPLPKPGEGWTLAASTYDGGPQWEPEWEGIGKAVRALSMFQELPDHQPDWAKLLRGFKHLKVLSKKTMPHPPLQHLSDFMQIGDYFLTLTSQNELPLSHLLYIIEDQPERTDPLLAEFDELRKRLRMYKPLQPYVEYMD